MTLLNGIKQWFQKKIEALMGKQGPISSNKNNKSKTHKVAVKSPATKSQSPQGSKSKSPPQVNSKTPTPPVSDPAVGTLSETRRWEALLKTLRLSPSKLLEQLKQELELGLSINEKNIAPKREGQFFDGLIIGRKVEELDQLALMLNTKAITDRLHSKIPTLAKWAKGEMGEPSLLASVCPEIVAWARQGKHFKVGELRESHLAEAIEMGQEKVMRSVMADGGVEKLDAEQSKRILEAFATRREEGLSEGLDSAALDTFAQAMGGWEAALESVGNLSLQEAINLIESMLQAIKEEALLDEKILKETNTKASKRTREIIAKAVALQAARENKPRILNSVLLNSQVLLGMSPAAAANIRSEYAKVKVGALVTAIQLKNDDMSLYEVAWLSQAPAAQEALRKAGAREIGKDRQKLLVNEVETQVKRLAMRSESGSKIAKVWRETLKDWKSGVLGEARMTDLQKVVDKKLEGMRQDGSQQNPEMDSKNNRLKM